jgi:type VI secretion system secreted protein VgrG
MGLPFTFTTPPCPKSEPAMAIETSRRMRLYSPLGEDKLLIRHLTGSERLGDCFEYTLTLFSEDADIDGDSLLGQHTSVGIQCGDQPERFIDGVVCEFSGTGYTGRYATYRAVLRPWLWLLSCNRNCRVFQQQTSLEIVKGIFKAGGYQDFSDRLLQPPPKREYCVQYRESDLAFVSRLLEDDGIYYYWKHERGRHELVLSDSSSAHDKVSKFETVFFRRLEQGDEPKYGAIYSWSSTKRIVAGSVGLVDYDFKKPRADLQVSSHAEREHAYARAEVFDHPGEYTEVKDGEDRARVRMQEIGAGYEVSEGSTNASGLFAGALFSLKNHPRSAENKDYLITAASYDADSGGFESGASGAMRFAAQLRAIASATHYRPPRLTRKPVISGAQTATVVGPKSSEIWTDEYGRIKVQFHWDREGKLDESSSCWMRVAQSWTGSGWGSQHVPRVGQEVVVDFLEGNPDQPLVTGCVYNDGNRPPFKLPDHQTQSGIRTRSTPHGGHQDFNELRFEDMKGSEEVFLQAQRNLKTSVKSDSTNSVGHDYSMQVKNNLKVVVGEGDFNTTVSNGTMLHYAPKNVYDVCAKEIVETADDAITFRVKDVSIRIDDKSISLNVGTATEIKLELATLTIIGPKVDINPMGGMPSGPAPVPPRPAAAIGGGEEPTFEPGGGGFGGAGASGTF